MLLGIHEKMKKTRILVIPNEFPLPANTGGRIDVWRRLQLLNRLGFDNALLTWCDVIRHGYPSHEYIKMLNSSCSTFHLSEVGRSYIELVKRFMHLGRLPSHAAARWVGCNKSLVLAWAKDFKPDLIVLDGLYGVAVARWLASELSVPWVYRSHNIEHHYMRVQFDKAKNIVSRMGLLANLIGLERLERETVHSADAVFDISPVDAEFWQMNLSKNITCLPTSVDDNFVKDVMRSALMSPLFDVLYFGNLNTPNNVEAIRWLIREILPLMRQPDISVGISGSRPSDEVISLVASDSRVRLIANPVNMAEIVGRSRVIVNPVQGGSGVNLKSVEMLFTNASLISTTAGVQGLTADAAACFDVHDRPADFAHALHIALLNKAPNELDLNKRGVAREIYTFSGAASIFDGVISNVLKDHKNNP